MEMERSWTGSTVSCASWQQSQGGVKVGLIVDRDIDRGTEGRFNDEDDLGRRVESLQCRAVISRRDAWATWATLNGRWSLE